MAVRISKTIMKTQISLRKILVSLFILFAFSSLGTVEAEDTKQNIKPYETFVSDLIKRLKNKGKISPLLSDRIVFIYHSDNRCDGSTDGKIIDLPRARIDVPFSIRVTNNGDGWECDKKKESTFEYKFHLTEKLTHWDRLEQGNYNSNDNKFNLYGGGESDYMVIHLISSDGKLVINKIEYRSEDPG